MCMFMLPYLLVPSTTLGPLVSVVPTVNEARQLSLSINIDVSMKISCHSLVCVVWLKGTCHVITYSYMYCLGNVLFCTQLMALMSCVLYLMFTITVIMLSCCHALKIRLIFNVYFLLLLYVHTYAIIGQ